MTDSPSELGRFADALRAFKQGEQSLSQLLDQIDHISASGQAIHIDLLAALIQHDASEPLPTEAFVAIEARLKTDDHWDATDPEDTIVEDEEDSGVLAEAGDIDVGDSDGVNKGGHAPAPARKPGSALPKIVALAGLVAIGIAIIGYSTFDGREAGNESPAQSAESAPVDMNEETPAVAAESGGAPTETNAQQSTTGQADAAQGGAPDTAALLSSEAWEQAQSQLQAIQQEQAQLVAKLDNQRAETEGLREELEQARGRLAEGRTELEETQQALQVDQRQASEARNDEMARLEATVTQLQAEVEKRKRETREIDRENQEQRESLMVSLDALQQQDQILQQTLEVRRSELKAAETELQRTQTELAERLANDDRSASEIQRLETRVRELQVSVGDEKRQTTALEQQSQEERTTLLGKLEELEEREHQLRQTLETRNQLFESVETELADVKQRQSQLERDAENRLQAMQAQPEPVAQQAAEQQPPQVNEPEPDAQRVRQLLALATQQLDADRLTLPAGDNAYETYQEVLQLAPGQEQAQRGVGRIKEQYKVWAESAFGSTNWRQARKHLEAALAIDPADGDLKSALRKLDRAQAAAERQAAQRTQQAQLAALLETGAGQLAAQRLIGPQGDNAWETFRSVIKIDADNLKARKGLQAIASRLESLARAKQREGNLQESLAFAEDGLRVVPHYPQLQRLRADLQRQLLAQQTGEPAAASQPPAAVDGEQGQSDEGESRRRVRRFGTF
ncbi:MAG: hypothetical protein ACR2RB_00065 [Gammaproteobacteria bacterium]